MATLLSGTDLATGTTINIPAEDITTVLQKAGETDCIVTYVSNKGIKTQVTLDGKDIDACSFQGGAIDGMIPVVLDSMATVVTGTATAGAAGTITLTGTSATNDVYNNMYCYITEGTGIGQVRKITDYVGATKVATIENNWTVTTDNTSVYIVAEVGNLIQATKVGLIDNQLGLFLYNNDGAAKDQLTLNSDQDAAAFVTYINTAIDEAAATYVTLSTSQTVSGAKNFTGGIEYTTALSGAGAVGTPAVQVGATNTGLYLVSATQTGFSQDGALVALFDANGIVTSEVNEQVVGVGVSVDSAVLKDGSLITVPTASAENVTDTLTAAQMLGGAITSTSAAVVALTTPTAASILALISGGGVGTQFDLAIDNSAGASTITLTLDGSITAPVGAVTGGNTLTVTTTHKVGIFRFYFTSPTAAVVYRVA